MNQQASSVTAMVDAQFSVAQVLRPFAGFEAVYQGQPADVPVAFPGTLDEEAGKVAGMSPYLLAGIPVALGSKVMLWFPMLATESGETSNFDDYVYVLHWRMRNVGAYQRTRVPYHLGTDRLGAADTLLAPGPRLVIPSATETVLYQQAEPSATPPFLAGTGDGLGNLRPQQIAIPADGTFAQTTVGLPFLPPGSAPPFQNPFPSADTTPLGIFQQGVLDPATALLSPTSLFRPYFTVAKGDELIVTVARRPRVTPPSPNVWDFASGGQDAIFSDFYGQNVAGPTHPVAQDSGIYLLTGTNPS